MDLQTLAQSVSVALGWEYSPSSDADRLKHIATIGLDGAEFTFHVPYGSKRIEIHGDFPRDKQGCYYKPYDGKFSISVSQDKTPERIARDIERRLLPEYLPAYQKAVEQKRQADADQARAESTAKSLAGILGASISSDRPLIFFAYNPSVDCEVYRDGTVRLKMSVSADVAERICREIAAGRTKESE